MPVRCFYGFNMRRFFSVFAPSRRRASGFLILVLTGAIVACSRLGQTTGVNVGPNFPSATLYASNTNQNAISIYTSGTASGKGPTFLIGGANTGLDGPRYLAFDRAQNLWTTNYDASTNKATLIQFAALATGDVVPLLTAALPGRPRGIAFTSKGPSPKPSTSASPVPRIMVVADNDPQDVYPNRILLYVAGTGTPYQSIGGPKPGLKLPGGVAIDGQGHIYVANIQGASVSSFTLPTPSPTPKPTPTHSPTPTPSPSPTPSTSPSPSPTPSPTPTPVNIFPRFSITSKNEVITPLSVALDSLGNIYIVDQGKPNAGCRSKEGPAILVFPPFNKKIPFTKPIRKIHGCNTMLNIPTDIKVNPKGITYVADESTTGAGVVLIFAAGANGNVTPTYYTSPGAVTGIGLVP